MAREKDSGFKIRLEPQPSELEALVGGEPPYRRIADELGKLVEEKQVAYGDSAGRAGKIIAILYPTGIRLDQYDDALLIVRILDKLSRISQRRPDGQDRMGESPFRDIAGYGILGAAKDER